MYIGQEGLGGLRGLGGVPTAKGRWVERSLAPSTGKN